MLAQTQNQLEDHFQELSRDRVPLGYSVYALDSDELDGVRKAEASG